MPQRGLSGVKPTRNGARRSAHPHGREKPPPGALISPYTTLGAVYASDAGSVLFLFGFARKRRKRPEPRRCRRFADGQEE